MDGAPEYRTPADWDMDRDPTWSVDHIVMVAKSYLSSEDFGHDHLSLLWLSLHQTEPSDDRLQIGQGATVSPDFVRARARMRFFWTLRQMVPISTSDLVTESALSAVSSWAKAMERWSIEVLALRDEGVLTESASDEAEKQAHPSMRALFDHIAVWQRSIHLLDPWVTRSAFFTLTAARSCYALTGEYYDGPLSIRNVAVSVHDGMIDRDGSSRRSPLRYRSQRMLKRRMVSLDDLMRCTNGERDRGGAMDEKIDEGEIGWFDTRTDTVARAVERLLPNLESMLVKLLEQFEAEDRAHNDAISPVMYKSPSAFEWLVRYQVLGVSRNAIAHAEGKDRAHVTREVNKLAALIGLTLRRERGGRPTKHV